MRPTPMTFTRCALATALFLTSTGFLCSLDARSADDPDDNYAPETVRFGASCDPFTEVPGAAFAPTRPSAWS